MLLGFCFKVFYKRPKFDVLAQYGVPWSRKAQQKRYVYQIEINANFFRMIV
jgi:hypothetical protein